MSKEAVLQRSRLHWYFKHFVHIEEVGSRRLVVCERMEQRRCGSWGSDHIYIYIYIYTHTYIRVFVYIVVCMAQLMEILVKRAKDAPLQNLTSSTSLRH